MFSYENLPVYKVAFETNRIIYRLIKNNHSIPSFLKIQLGRASMSVMLNIAEGSGKFGKRDRRNFFIISRGSVFECAALINFLSEEGEISITQKNELYSELEQLSRMLFAMIKNLDEL